jgi:hypothetical protein
MNDSNLFSLDGTLQKRSGSINTVFVVIQQSLNAGTF